MKIKSILAYTAVIASIAFIGAVSVENRNQRLDRISAKVIEGDLSILGNDSYYYKDYGYSEDLLLTFNKDGITRDIDSTPETDSINFFVDNESGSDYPEIEYQYGLKFSKENFNQHKEFYNHVMQYDAHTLYYLLDEPIAICTEILEKNSIKLSVIIDNDGNIKEEEVTIPYDKLKLKNSNGITDFDIKSANKVDDKIQIFLVIDHYSDINSTDLDDIIKSHVYVEIDLKTKDFKVQQFNNFKYGLNAIIENNAIYVVCPNDKFSLTKIDIANNFKTSIIDKSLQLKTNKPDSFATESGFDKIGNTLFYLQVFIDGTMNLKYFDVNDEKIYEYKDFKIFKKIDFEEENPDKIEGFIITQVFIDNGNLFINYNYTKRQGTREEYLKVINLEKGTELLIETIGSRNFRGDAHKHFGKLID